LRRFQLWLLVFTALWLLTLAVGGLAALNSANADAVVLSGGGDAPWTSYPPQSSTWQLGFGDLLLWIGGVGFIADAVTRLAVWVGRGRRPHTTQARAVRWPGRP
jgi:hypothetical protein